MSYRVEMTDVAEAEAEQAMFWLLGVSPDYAGKWYDGLLRSFEGLSEMPYRFPIAPVPMPEEYDIRMMLYGRRSHMYRVLFRIIEDPQSDGSEGIIRVLHVVHAARDL